MKFRLVKLNDLVNIRLGKIKKFDNIMLLGVRRSDIKYYCGIISGCNLFGG